MKKSTKLFALASLLGQAVLWGGSWVFSVLPQDSWYYNPLGLDVTALSVAVVALGVWGGVEKYKEGAAK